MAETNTGGNGQLSLSRHSTQSAANSNTEKMARTISGGQRDGVNDDSKSDEEDAVLSMAGLERPCPPALQLQSSVDSVVMGAVNAAMIANPSPAAIHVQQAQQLALAQQANAYAHAHAASQLRGMQSYLNPYANYALTAAMSQDYGDAVTATAAAAAPSGPYAYNVSPAMIGCQMQALRIQPPATLSSRKLTANTVEDQWMTGLGHGADLTEIEVENVPR